MSTIQTVKTQIQSLIDLANTTTGNTDTNLTDGVNALVSGYGQGGDLPTDTLVGLENGYDVMFYDENNMGLAFYSIKQGHTINPPEYKVKNWQDANGGVIVFPYTPSGDAIFYANNSTLGDQLYKFYGVDKAIYPYVIATNKGVRNTLAFAKTKEDTNLKGLYWTPSVIKVSYSGTTIEEFVEHIMNVISVDSLVVDEISTHNLMGLEANSTTSKVADNFDFTYPDTPLVYDLDQ